MSRTTTNKVKSIVEVPANGALTDAMIDGFIEDAALIVEEELASAGMTEARLELIERYLAAHMITVLTERGGLTSSEVDGSKDTYSSFKDGAGLTMTRYGQMAIGFDSSGRLKLMASSAKANTLSGQFRVM